MVRVEFHLDLSCCVHLQTLQINKVDQIVDCRVYWDFVHWLCSQIARTLKCILQVVGLLGALLLLWLRLGLLDLCLQLDQILFRQNSVLHTLHCLVQLAHPVLARKHLESIVVDILSLALSRLESIE